MRRLAPWLLLLAACWPYDFDHLLAECADGGLSCQADGGQPGLDAGVLDAGLTDAGVMDAGVDPCATALFCEHFDDEADGGYLSRWSLEQTGQWSVSIEAQSRAGAGALRIDLGDAGETQYKLARGYDGGSVWLRFFYRVSQLPDDDLYLAGLRSSQNDHENIAVGVSTSMPPYSEAFLKSNWPSGQSRYVTVDAGTGWHCLEASLAFASTSMGQLFLDGASVTSANLGGVSPAADTITLGPYLYVTGPDGGLGVGTPRTVWLDEFVLSRTRPGCGP
jgi:hypothetical protein